MRGWGTGHVQPDLGDDHLGGLAADAGDLIQAIGRGEQDRRRLRASALVGGAAAAAPWLSPDWSWGGWAAGTAAIRSSIRAVRWSVLGGQRVDVVQGIRASSAWWSSKRPVNACTRAARLRASDLWRARASTLGSRCPTISASTMSDPRRP